jgi:DNA repair protein RadC
MEMRKQLPHPGTRNERLKKRAYEFKLARVREAGGSRKIESPDEAFDYWMSTVARSEWFQESKEHLVVLLLNTRRHIEGHNLVSIGTLNETLAHPREILSPVLCGAAYAFVLMHNHPSGDPSPSRADRELTRRIREGAELLQIKFLDHVIAGRASAGKGEPYFSFKEMGLL